MGVKLGELLRDKLVIRLPRPVPLAFVLVIGPRVSLKKKPANYYYTG